MRKLLDESGKTLGVLQNEKFVPMDPRVAGWDSAVPSMRGTIGEDGGLREMPVSIPATDSRYGLAFAHAIEERGWAFEDSGNAS